MSSRSLGLTLALFLVSLGCSGNPAPGPFGAPGASRRVLGTPASMLKEASRTGLDRFQAHLQLPTDRGELIDLVPEDIQLSGGYLSATGSARGADRSSFILKGDSQSLYGWVVLPDQDRAYEYTTSSTGEVVVQQVPVTDIEPVCDPDPDPDTDGAPFADPVAEDVMTGDPPHVGVYEGSDTSKLQSKPGATKVLFMDVAPLTLPKDQLWRAWQVVAASFSAFDVNVTTDEAAFMAADPRNRGKACSRAQAGRSSCSLNAFGTSRCCNVFNKGNGYYQGTTTAHELGHLMGLRHDGAPGSEYFRGLPAFRWCPIMGANTPKTSWGAQALFQWSKGEYQGANNKEDDLAIISKNLPFRKDDIPDAKPLVIRNGSQVSAADNRGLIETNTDSDSFTFTVGSPGGRAMLLVDRLEYVGGAYLDVEAQLQNAAGMMIARGNDPVARTARLEVTLPPGDYRLIIKGGSEGTPLTGFSSYSSLGYYGISGTITASVGGVTDAGAIPGSDGGAGDAAPGGTDAGAGGGPALVDAANGAPGGGAGAGGSSGAGTGGSSGDGAGRPGGRGSPSGAGGQPAPREPTPGPVIGGCAVAAPGSGSDPSPGVAGLLALVALLAGARRRRRRAL